ncbi:MAG: PAS domain S-box protein [Actinomycetota bacterium]|nr:PAS domain S-box protein [Actinomycetota bacterium]MDQ3788542.1 PAS domain S-box protein [Actinomycetota bacterium]
MTDIEHPERGEVLVRRRAMLAPEATSARKARHLLRATLVEVDRSEWADTAELALSEVVTNAALHAHTPIEVDIEVYTKEVCIQVRDLNPVLPVQRDYGDEALTGRGLGLVAAIARGCGVESLGSDGKIVWFCVGAPTQPDPAAVLAAWDFDGPAVPGGATCVDVVLQSMPATLWLSARQHHDGILRELVYHLAEHPEVEVDMAAVDSARSTISTTLVGALDDAAQRGQAKPPVSLGHPSPLPWVPPSLDLRLRVEPQASRTFAALQDALDTAEALAVDGALLTRPGLPEIVAVRDWACEQVIAQLRGAPPQPWPGTAQERFETTVHDRSQAPIADWDASVVVDATSPVIAGDDANRIIAVSRPLADLLGWEVDDLVGRRVVTVVPPSLREAHVAGFTRHLATGEGHVIGIPTVLPVLTRSGVEIPCHFLLEQAPATAGRSVYLAWISPVETGPERSPEST